MNIKYIIIIILFSLNYSYSQVIELRTYKNGDLTYHKVTSKINQITTVGDNVVFLLNDGSTHTESITEIDSTIFITGKKFREFVKNKPRPLIQNNDGADMIYFTNGLTPTDFYASRFDGASFTNSQVSTYDYCTWSAGFGNYTHNTNVMNKFTTTESIFSNNKLQDFLNQGTDALQMAINYAQNQNWELFWNMRMNDTHDGVPSAYQQYMLAPFKTNHSELLMGTGNSDTTIVNGRWSNVDYTLPAVREFAFQLIEEVCDNYDIDGITLDFFRASILFKNTALGNICNDSERQMMTELMRDIRNMADEKGFERGKPILIAMRTADDIQYCKDIGLDIETWMQEDLLDLWFATGYFMLNHPDYSINLGHQYGVKVYPSVDESRIPDSYRQSRAARNKNACFYGRAQNWLNDGADGIYSFNYENNFNSLGRLQVYGDLNTLTPQNKIYVTDGARGNMKLITSYPDPENYFRFTYVDPLNTYTITNSQTGEMDIQVADDCNTINPSEIKLRLRYDVIPEQTDDVTIDINGFPLTNPNREAGIVLNSTFGYSIETRIKIDNAEGTSGAGTSLSCSPKENENWLLLFPVHDGKVWAKFYYNNSTEIIIDNDINNSTFHTIRITVENSNVNLYVDGNSIPNLTTTLANGNKLPLGFGDISGATNADYYIDYVYACENAVAGNITPTWIMTYEADYKPDLNYSTTYNGTTITERWDYNHQEYSSVDNGILRINTLGTTHDCSFRMSNKVWYNYTLNNSDVLQGWNTVHWNLSSEKPSIILSDLIIEINQ